MTGIPADIHAEPDGPRDGAPDTARLRAAQRRLNATEARLRRAEARLASLENSTALRVGQMLATTARNPARVPLLPRDLYRLWRRRAVRSAAPPAPRALGPAAYEEERLLVGASGPAPSRPLVAGVLTRTTAETLATVAEVAPLLPHNAAQILGHTQPDVIVVEAAACGEGAWLGLGDPAATDLEERLLDAVRGTGPRVLLVDAPCPPGLRRHAWDHIADGPYGTVGVDLATHHPLGARPRATEPLLAWPDDPRAGAHLRGLRRVLTAGTPYADAEGADPARRAGLMRGHLAVVAGTSEAVVEALACGAWVIAPDVAVPDDLRPHVLLASDADQVAKHLASIEGPRPYAEVRAALRTVFARHTAAARLAGLIAAARPEPEEGEAPRAEPPGAREALAGRRVTVLTRGDVTAAGQTHPPAAVIADPDAPWHELAARAGTPWIAYGDPGGWPPEHLADLVCAAEYAGADAVGLADRDAPAYVDTVTPALARRDLAASGGPAATWPARHGARLLAVPQP